MKLSDFAVDSNSRPLKLKNPKTGEILLLNEQPVIIHCLGMDAPEVAKVQRENANASMNAAEKKMTVEMIDNGSIKVLSVAITGFDNLEIDDETGPLKFSRDAAYELLIDPRFPWIRDQVSAFVATRSNFIGTLASS